MVTVCLSQRLMARHTVDSLHLLNDALISFVSRLKVHDYICLNIGNQTHILTNDAQRNLKSWKVSMKYLQLDTNADDDLNIVKQFIKTDHSPLNALPTNTKNVYNRRKTISNILSIIINLVFVILYSIILNLSQNNPNDGDCYASSGVLVPLFSNPNVY